MSDEKKIIILTTVFWAVFLLMLDIGYCVLWTMTDVLVLRITIGFIVTVSNISLIVYLIWWTRKSLKQ